MVVWRRCSVCKKDIGIGAKYYKCSINSCHKLRVPTQFCSVSCWDSHNAILRHRDAGAMEEKAPMKSEVN